VRRHRRRKATLSPALMTKSTRLIVTAAALAGLYSGSLALQARADDANPGNTPTKSTDQKNSCNGKSGCNGKTQNSCKAKASCKGQDAAKSKDASKATDAGKPAAKPDAAKASCSGPNGCSGATKDNK